MDDPDYLSPLATYALAAFRERLDGIVGSTRTAMRHATRLQEAGEAEAARVALREMIDALHNAATLAEDHARRLGTDELAPRISD